MVKLHLYKNGFMYDYHVWIHHGEQVPHVNDNDDHVRVSSSDVHVDESEQFVAMQDMVCDALGQHETFEPSNFNNREEPPNEEAQRFYDLLLEANEPLFEGAVDSKLSMCMKLLACKSNWNVPNQCLDFITTMLSDATPIKEGLPKSDYDAKRLVSMLGLKAKRIDCCVKGCMLFYDNEYGKNDGRLLQCKFCHHARYHDPKVGTSKRKPIPLKIMFYFPIIPRLQRLFASMQTSGQMTWHYDNRRPSGVLRHPSDGEAWKHFDQLHPKFAAEPRNIRLGLCSDGFNPYIQASTKPYSCWPVIVTPYNLPPEMCMSRPYMFLSCLIPGPHNPKARIDVYLQPLIDDLKKLWSGVQTYDISRKQNFMMRASLMWTINDFPAYGMLSGWGTQGKLACPRNKKAFKKDKVEMGGPSPMLTSEEVWNIVRNLPTVIDEPNMSKLPGYGEWLNWTKRSIFWDLPYWKDNLLRHNLDAMHIEKNFFDNIFNTIMDVKGKTKDNDKARKDLTLHCRRPDLELKLQANGKILKPKANYTLTTGESKLVYQWIKELRMPDGYSSNLARCVDVDKGKMLGMKSHDCHIFMECLLPIAFHSLPVHVLNPLIEVSHFFKDLCSTTIKDHDLVRMEENISIILCKLE
ncbi:uncharacterized protein [Phaseolus vulgaris]|uniref:uncharacterized protein n=1 Tax=Phaseolus vulgaris TaxID=3885 RepID=UPI0035C99BE0